MRKLPLVVAVALLGLPGCGGGSGSSSPTTFAPTTTTTSTTTTTTLPPRNLTDNLAGSLSAGDAPCSSPGSIHDQKPCARFGFTSTNAGAMQATLTWNNSRNDLDLELWRGTSRLVNTLGVTTTEVLSSNVTPGTYEVRVVYYRGETTQNFNLELIHPN